MIIKLFDNFNIDLFEKITHSEFNDLRERSIPFSEKEIQSTHQLLYKKFDKKFTRLYHKYERTSKSSTYESFYFECGYNSLPNEIDMYIYKTDDDYFILYCRISKGLRYDILNIKCDYMDGLIQFINSL